MRKIISAKLELARVTPPSLRGYVNEGFSGFFRIHGPCNQDLTIISSPGEDKVCEGWEHVSVSTPNRCPNWPEMCFVKELFWLPEEWVVQFHPAKDEQINNHPYVLHMWHNPGIDFPKPPPILVGIKGL
jgi:hypothetical protein